MPNRLVLIGNGFDLAHGLKTSYNDFLNWYMCNSFDEFCSKGNFEDNLVSMKRKYFNRSRTYNAPPKNVQDVIKYLSIDEYEKLHYNSQFFKKLISLLEKGWVDIERQYFQKLKSVFLLTALSDEDKQKNVQTLNKDFDQIISLLTTYINTINSDIKQSSKLPLENPQLNFQRAFERNESMPVTFLNFNYTETLVSLGYASENDIIHIHGRASQVEKNPIIFGYGDETDPIYQAVEDSGENSYLEHIKSFAYYKTDNYKKLIDLIDSDEYEVFVCGHSCGLSDRILLSEIFEHKNCSSIEVFYHKRNDGSDNFKEITQEISRHFKPQNKAVMRRRIVNQDSKNIIPQQAN